jgi:PAS domain S-box-containing protein
LLKADQGTADIPVIFMTALESVVHKVKGFQEGAVDYLTKPVQTEELLARVTVHLHIRELTQSLQDQTLALAQANEEIQNLNAQLQAENIRVSADLRESERKYRTLVEEMSDGYVVIEEGNIVFANQAFCEMHGYQIEEVISKPLSRFVDPEDHKKIEAIYRRSHQEKSGSYLYEYLRLTKDGRSLFTEITIRTTHYENRLVDISICRDITERVGMEQRMREAERLAYIGRITASLSHEIRNPLSAVKMNLQILKKRELLQDNDARRVDISIQEVMRLEGILSELLDFAKPLSLKITICHVNQILTSCLELLQIKFDQKKLAIIPTLDSAMPEMQADREKLSQAFMNLLLNAFEASDEHGTLWIRSRYHPQPGTHKLEVMVEDEGTGLPKKLLDDIFKPFFTTKEKGTGLGLTNVKNIIEAHKGRIEAENRHPHGAIFRIWLPA